MTLLAWAASAVLFVPLKGPCEPFRQRMVQAVEQRLAAQSEAYRAVLRCRFNQQWSNPS